MKKAVFSGGFKVDPILFASKGNGRAVSIWRSEMAIEVFNRFERKFVLDPDHAAEVQERLLDRMRLDPYSQMNEFYTISNLYYDTEDNELVRTSLSKPMYKEKLRLRAYGIPAPDSEVYLEIKKKFDGKVNKRRTVLHLGEAYGFLRNGQRPVAQSYMNRQVMDEIDYFLRRYDVEPRLYLAYDRRALFSVDDSSLRITFDENIRTRRHDLRLELGDYGTPLMDDGEIVMEIKTRGNLPLWLTGQLSVLGVFRRSFSKYGREYQNLLERARHTRELAYA